MSANSGAIRAGRAFVELFADNTKLQQGLRVAEKQIKEFGAKVSSMGKQIATLGGVAALPGVISTKIFAGFDDQMRAVQAVTGSTGEAFDQLTEKAKLLGRTTSYTAQEVASGMLELGRAGFKSDEIDEAIASVMDLARATQTEILRATEIAGNALRGFGLDASEMGRVSDVLATTANNSAQTLDDLGEAFKYVAPIADTAGMSLEETAKVLGTLANFGIKGSLAGTAVKNILTRMADPDVQAAYEVLGIKVKDTAGNLRNMADVLKEVGQATASMPNAEKLAIFKELFDMRALAGGAKLTAESFQSLCDAIDNASGESDRVAKQMDAGIGGSFRMFLSAAEGMAIAIGTTLSPEIKRLSDYLTAQQTVFTEWINEHKETIISCTKLAAKVLLLGVGLYVVGTAASAVANIIGLFRGTLIATRAIITLTSGAIQGFSLASTVAAVKMTALTTIQKINAAVTGLSRAVYVGATTAIRAFSAANIASAASIVKVTAVSLAAKGAVTAYGIASTICAGATRALSAALTLICAHPVMAALTVLGGVLAGLCIYLKDAGKYTAQLSDEMTKLAEAGNKTRTLDDKKMEGIGKLGAKSEKGSLSDEEFTKGKIWVEELTSRYGDLGIQIDAVNQKIIAATDSQKKFLDAVNQKALQDKDSVIKEEERNLAELEKQYQAEVDRMQGWSGWLAMEARGVGQVFSIGYVDSAEEAWPKQLEEENKKIEEQKKKLAELRKERQMLEGGDTTITKGGSIDESVQNQVDNINPSANAPGSPAEFEEKLRNTEGAKQQEEIAALQSEYQKTVAQIQSQINSAMTQEEKDAGTARLERLDKLFTAKMAELTAALPENKAQSDFWDKINDKGMSEEEKEIAQLNKDLTTVLEAIKTEVTNAVNNTKEGDVPQIKVSANELTTAYQPELETVSTKSDGAKSLVEKATSGEYTNPEEFQTDSQKVIGELDKTLEEMNPGPEREKLEAAIEALKIFCETFAKTIGSEDKSAKVDAVTGSGIKQKAAQNATDTQIQGVRNKYTKERQQKMKDTEIEDLPLNQAAQNRDAKKMALDTAKAGGDKKQIRKAQLEYDQASNQYDETERNKYQNDLDSSAKEMQTALDDYNNAGEDTAKREDAKRRYDTAKSKHDNAQSYFNEKGSPESQQIAANTRQAKTKRDEKKIALDEGIESGDRKQIAQAQKEYDTSQKEYENAQYKQNLNTATQTADQNVESTSASYAEKKFNLQQAQMTGDPDQIEQAQSEYNEADYAKKQAEYQKAMADAQNSAQEVSDAEKNLKEVMKHGTPEEKAAAKQRLKEAKANQKDALKRLKSFDTGKAVRSASPDYSNPQSSNERGEKGEQEKPEIKDTASGTFDAFEALGQNYDWQKTNGERQLNALVDIRSLLEQQDGTYI